MDRPHRLGAIAAFILAATYVIGFGMFVGLIDSSGYDGPAGRVAFVVDHEAALTIAMIILYIVAGLALVALVTAMHRRASETVTRILPFVSSVGLIWAGIVIASGMIGLAGIAAVTDMALEHPDHAASAWTSIAVIQDALGGGNELLGGVWMASVSWLSLRAGQMNTVLASIGIALGAVGIASIVPAAGDLVDIFGLGQIVWFIGLGVILLKDTRSEEISANA